MPDKYDVADIESSLEGLPDDGLISPVEAVDELVGVPDGLQLRLALPDGEIIHRGLNLDHLTRWYVMVADGRSGYIPFAHGYGEIRYDPSSSTVRCDLSLHSLGDHEPTVIEAGPTLTGPRQATLELLQPLIRTVLDMLVDKGVSIASLKEEVILDEDGSPYDEAVWESLLG